MMDPSGNQTQVVLSTKPLLLLLHLYTYESMLKLFRTLKQLWIIFSVA